MAFKKSKPMQEPFAMKNFLQESLTYYKKKIHLTRPNLHHHESSSFIHDHTVIKNQKKNIQLI